MNQKLAVVLSRNRSRSVEQQRLEDQLLQRLQGRTDVEVIVLAHLYDLAPDGAGMQLLRSVPGDLAVLCWLYPRAAYWVLDANAVRGRLGPTFSLPPSDVDHPAHAPGAEGPARTIWCFDLRSHDCPEPYLAEIEQIARRASAPLGAAEGFAGRAEAVREVAETVRDRWYPVVDFGRCVHCLECLNFCLFGVYGLGESDKVLIEQPDACRDGCPACSRICPQGAIMFPQHTDPAIAGHPQASLEGLKLDLSQLFGGVSPAELAARERERAQKENGRQGADSAISPASKPAEKDQLDRLIDEVDGMDL